MPFFRLELQASSDDFPALIDTSTFLYDFNLIYELARLTVDPEWDGLVVDEDAWSRDGRPLHEFERLHVVSLRQGSPLELVAVVTAAAGASAALWALVQVVEKLSNWRLNRDILRMQREKLRRELAGQTRMLTHARSSRGLMV